MKKTLFLLSAFVFAPLPMVAPAAAQETPAVADGELPPWLLTDAQEAATAPATAAAGMSALAALPADAEGFIAVGKIDELTNAIPMESAAIAFGAGSAASAKQLVPVYTAMSNLLGGGEMTDSWQEVTHQMADAVIDEQLDQIGNESVDRAIEALKAWRMAPLYAAATISAETKEMLPQLQQEILTNMADLGEKTTIGNWTGVRVNMAPMAAEADLELSTLQQMQLQEAIRQMPLYIMTIVHDNAIVLCICSDPAALRLPENAAASLQSAPCTAFMATKPEAKVAASFTPALSNVLNEYSKADTNAAAGLLSGVFKTLAKTDTAHAAPYQAAAKATETLSGTLNSLADDDRTPLTVLAWVNETANIDIEGDAHGLVFTPTEGIAAPTDSIFTISFDKATTPDMPMDWKAVRTAAVELVQGLILTLDDESRGEAEALTEQAAAFGPEAEAIGQALITWTQGLDCPAVFVMDGKGQAPASLVGGDPSQNVSMLRAALTTAVTDRAALSKAWEQLMTAAAQGLTKATGDASVLQQLPLSESKSGDSTIFSVVFPGSNADVSPCLAVSGTRTTLSSSASLAGAMNAAPSAATKTAPGIYMTFNMKALNDYAAGCPALIDEETRTSLDQAAQQLKAINADVTNAPGDRVKLHIEIVPSTPL